jgi:hypothetical protein
VELADQLRNESKLVVGMRRTAADDEAEHLATFSVEPQHPRRPLEPDELQMDEESVHRLRPGTCRTVNGLADTHYIGEPTVESRATGGVFAGSHSPTISSRLAGARKLTVSPLRVTFPHAGPDRCRRPRPQFVPCPKPSFATDALAKNAKNATKITEGIVAELPSLLVPTKFGPNTASNKTASHIMLIASAAHISRILRNSAHCGRRGL